MDRIYINILTVAKREKLRSQLFSCIASSGEEAKTVAREFVLQSQEFVGWHVQEIVQQTLPDEMIEAAYQSLHSDGLEGSVVQPVIDA